MDNVNLTINSGQISQSKNLPKQRPRLVIPKLVDNTSKGKTPSKLINTRDTNLLSKDPDKTVRNNLTKNKDFQSAAGSQAGANEKLPPLNLSPIQSFTSIHPSCVQEQIQNKSCLPKLNPIDNKLNAVETFSAQIKNIYSKICTIQKSEIEKIHEVIDDLKNLQKIFSNHNVFGPNFSPQQIDGLRKSVFTLYREPLTGNKKSLYELAKNSDELRWIVTECDRLSVALEALNHPAIVEVSRHKLGEGNCNTVFLAKDADENEIVVKPCDKSGDRMQVYGIEKTGSGEKKTNAKMAKANLGTVNATLGARNFATSKINEYIKKIGHSLNPQVDIPDVVAAAWGAMCNKEPSIAMERISGKTAKEFFKNRGNLTPNLIKEYAWIQLIDVITGNTDRHYGNIMIYRDADGECYAKAIDHELSFPTKGRNENNNFKNISEDQQGCEMVVDHLVAAYGTKGVIITPDITSHAPMRLFAVKGSDGKSVMGMSESTISVDGLSARNYCIPWVIDRDMERVIDAIDPKMIKKICETEGLTAAETEPTYARICDLKKKIQNRGVVNQNNKNKIIQNCKITVIEPNEWDEEVLKNCGCDETNSYALSHCYARFNHVDGGFFQKEKQKTSTKIGFLI